MITKKLIVFEKKKNIFGEIRTIFLRVKLGFNAAWLHSVYVIV